MHMLEIGEVGKGGQAAWGVGLAVGSPAQKDS